MNQLKNNKFKPHNLPDVKDDQLLGLLLGPPGAGKSFSIQELGKIMGWNVLFTGTTHTAAAELDGGNTINGVCQLGPNHDNFKYPSIDASKITKIRNALKDVDLLVIDEVSMLTPVTLAKINLHLQAAFDKNYVFGGKDIVLVGDFWQFPPVSEHYQNKMALYQAAVRVERNQTSPNQNYEKGAKLFMLFKLVQLIGQKRAKKDYNIWLSKLRDYRVKYPITEEWLKRLNILKPEDMTDEKIDWTFTPTIVTGNYERRKIIQYKMILFAKRYQEPILRWVNKVAIGKLQQDKRKNDYENLDFDPEDIYPELIQYFVRGAECMLTEKVHGFPKGTVASYIGVAWENPDEKVDLDQLPTGEVTNVKVPDYVIVQIIDKKDKKNKKNKKPKIIPLQTLPTRFEDKIGTRKSPKNKNGRRKKVYRSFKAHPCELTISKTYHKTQGGTYDSIMLSINSVLAEAQKIKKLEITSLYVGLSRVHDFHEQRVLPFSREQRKALTKLTIDPLLRIYLQNYDNEGNWIKGILKRKHQTEVQQKKLELGMIDFDSLTTDDFQEFITALDLHMEGPKKKETYQTRLRKIHSDATTELRKNNGRLLKQKRINFTKKLLKENITKMRVKRMRYYAKRFGLKNTKDHYTKTLTPYLQNIITNAKKLANNIETEINVENVTNMESDTDNETSNQSNDQEIIEQMKNNNNIDKMNEEDSDIQMSTLNHNYNVTEMDEDDDIYMNVSNHNHNLIENDEDDDIQM